MTIGASARDATGAPLDCGSYTWSFSTADLPTVRRDIGTGAGDFWTVYPDAHPSSGEDVAHPDWVISSLEQGVVLILDHSEGCYPCIQQTQICESVYASHPELQYFDLLSGTDEPSASQAFAAYDPNGGVHYVPLTIVVTKAQDDLGNTVVAWHSWEGVVDLVTLTSWIQDATVVLRRMRVRRLPSMDQRTRSLVIISASVVAVVLLAGFLTYWTERGSRGVYATC